jgi:hypothetical protein
MIEIICVGIQGKMIDLRRHWVVKSGLKARNLPLNGL